MRNWHTDRNTDILRPSAMSAQPLAPAEPKRKVSADIFPKAWGPHSGMNRRSCFARAMISLASRPPRAAGRVLATSSRPRPHGIWVRLRSSALSRVLAFQQGGELLSARTAVLSLTGHIIADRTESAHRRAHPFERRRQPDVRAGNVLSCQSRQ
jgi:hypothetical protein